MATLPVVTRDDRFGVVFVRDERQDGTIVVLTCTDPAQGGSAAPSHLPEEEEEWFPFAEHVHHEASRGHHANEHFHLTIDTSLMPEGRLNFNITQFTARAQLAAEHGEREFALDNENAQEWGIEPPHKGMLRW